MRSPSNSCFVEFTGITAESSAGLLPLALLYKRLLR